MRPAVSIGLRGLALLMAVAGGLSACSADQEELNTWMDQQRRSVRPSVQPLVAPKKFEAAPYDVGQAVDPFNNQKLSVALKQEARQPNSLLAAEMSRRKEALEQYPTDAMVMVGSMTEPKSGRQYALLKVDNLLYQVKIGDHLGLNFGKVTHITETEVGLREIVQDAAGEWIERTSTLQLQEKGR